MADMNPIRQQIMELLMQQPPGQPLNILPYRQPPGRVGTVEGVDVLQHMLNGNGNWETTPQVMGPGIPRGLY